MTVTLAEERVAEPPRAVPVEPATAPCPDPVGRPALLGLGALFLVATFIQAPGLIIDDTKLPVIMAPMTWMQSALHMWSQTVASGSVQDETFGYLFPMAPFFELTHLLHVPVWCAERIWLALLLTVGAWGVIRVAEALGIGKRWIRVLGGVAYCVAPIVVDWAATSAVLLAVMLLPWLLHPLIVGSREGSTRRAAAKSGVALALMGGVNATVIFSTLPLAVIWLVTRAAGPRRRSLMGWWIVSVVLACFWWVVPTVLQGKYGYNYLPYTETSSVTTATGSAFEALRGASFWQNYDDLGGPLVPGGWTLVTSGVAIVATSIVTAFGLAGLARRIPERLFLVASLCFGVVVIAIGYGGTLGSPFSPVVVRLLSGALGPLRNVSKFSPDVTLPLALGLIWFVSTVSLSGFTIRRFHRPDGDMSRPVIGVVAVVAVVLAAMPFWQRQLYPPGGFTAIPHYWEQAADWLDGHQGHQTALLVPGANFAEYTWGRPQDEPLADTIHVGSGFGSAKPGGKAKAAGKTKAKTKAKAKPKAKAKLASKAKPAPKTK
ncbi:MAG: alpha-(1-_3)-arabinofuranosyltransferase family protein, partial [Acidimicrobiales bacterium]